MNPFASKEQAQQVATHIQQYGSNAFFGGDATAYGRFGGNPSDFINTETGQIDTALILPKIMERLQTGRGLALSQAGGNVAQLNKWITDITGSPDTINMLNATKEQQAAAEKTLDLTKQQIDETEAATEKISHLVLAWDNFINHTIVSLAQIPAAIEHEGAAPFCSLQHVLLGLPKELLCSRSGVKRLNSRRGRYRCRANALLWGTKDDPYGLYGNESKRHLPPHQQENR